MLALMRWIRQLIFSDFISSELADKLPPAHLDLMTAMDFGETGCHINQKSSDISKKHSAIGDDIEKRHVGRLEIIANAGGTV